MPQYFIKEGEDGLRLPSTRTLWEEVFEWDSASFLDYYYDKKTAVNEMDVDIEGERVAAMVQWNPFRLFIGGAECLCGDEAGSRPAAVRIPYIVGVATVPDCRHQGRMARLLSEGLRREASRGTPFVWLIPADSAIYEPFGFRYAGTKYCVRMKSEATSSADGVWVAELTRGNIKEVSHFLNKRLGELFDIFAERDEAYLWDAKAQYESDGGGVGVIFCDESPSTENLAEGFSSSCVAENFMPSNSVDGFFTWWPEDEGITVRELVLSERLEKRGMDAISSLLRSWFHRKMAVSEADKEVEPIKEAGATEIVEQDEKAEVTERVDPIEKVEVTERVDPIEKAEITIFTTGWAGGEMACTPVQNVMIRIANVRHFLELFRSDAPCHVRIRITDDIVEDNNLTFGWTIGKDFSEAVPVEDAGIVRSNVHDPVKQGYDHHVRGRVYGHDAGDREMENFAAKQEQEEILSLTVTELAQWLLKAEATASDGELNIRSEVTNAIRTLSRIHLPECV